MKTYSRLIMVLAAFSYFAQACDAQQEDDARHEKLPTGEEVLLRYVEVTGGKDAYKAIKTTKTTGGFSIPAQGLKGTLEITTVKPGKIASIVEIEGMGNQKQICDGKRCWEDSTMNGVRLVTGAEAKQMKKQSQLEIIYNPKKFFKTMENKGIEKVKGEECYKISLVTKDGDKVESYFSVKTGLQTKSITDLQTPMGPLKTEAFSSGYKKINGISTAMKIEQVFSNGMTQIIQMDKIEYNIDVPDSVFELPEKVQKLIDKTKSKK